MPQHLLLVPAVGLSIVQICQDLNILILISQSVEGFPCCYLAEVHPHRLSLIPMIGPNRLGMGTKNKERNKQTIKTRRKTATKCSKRLTPLLENFFRDPVNTDIPIDSMFIFKKSWAYSSVKKVTPSKVNS